MDNFALIDVLQEYCDDNNIKFLYGDEFYQNADASLESYAENQLVLIADFDFQPLITRAGAIEGVNYIGIIGLGRKFETPDAENPEGTASLDENYTQKYNRRLKDLTSLLVSTIITISCENELEAANINGRFEVNKFDTVIDFVVTNLTWSQ